MTLGALSSRSALSVLVGALFKKFGLFLNAPRKMKDAWQSRKQNLKYKKKRKSGAEIFNLL
jgi:hypothetical protein